MDETERTLAGWGNDSKSFSSTMKKKYMPKNARGISLHSTEKPIMIKNNIRKDRSQGAINKTTEKTMYRSRIDDTNFIEVDEKTRNRLRQSVFLEKQRQEQKSRSRKLEL